jgi:hypothetical protein
LEEIWREKGRRKRPKNNDTRPKCETNGGGKEEEKGVTLVAIITTGQY